MSARERDPDSLVAETLKMVIEASAAAIHQVLHGDTGQWRACPQDPCAGTVAVLERAALADFAEIAAEYQCPRCHQFE